MGKRMEQSYTLSVFTHVYLSVVKQLIQKQVVIKHLMWEGQGDGTTEVYGNVHVSSVIYERKDYMIQLIRSLMTHAMYPMATSEVVLIISHSVHMCGA